MNRQPASAFGTPPAHAVLQPKEEEIEEFEEEVGHFHRGEVDPAEFRAYRLQMGTYGQRQPDNHMVRVKVPFGGLNADQLEALGQIAEEYSGTGRGHVTTRQNFQFHFVKLDRVPEVMRILAKVGLTTREACGNTVRNVTACPLAGVCRGEAFDTTPYAAAYARYFLRNAVTQKLPRKFKTAFSGCDTDCAVTPIHDLGFIARVQEENGVQRRGFQIVVGGGLSTMPRYADTLYDFVPVEDYLNVAEAVLRVFDRLGERKNRNKARIKFLVKRLGLEEFKRLVEEELQQPWAQVPKDLAKLAFLPEEVPPPKSPSQNGHLPAEERARYEAWRATNVTPQRQPGYVAAHVTLPLGDIYPEQFRALARAAREYSGGHLRTSIEQDLVLRWIPEERLPELYRDLVQMGLGEDGAGTIADIVSCPGADSCSLAITSSRGLGRALGESLRKLDFLDADLKRIPIKISGCPNGCGQHLLGGIGFQGASVHQNNHEVPSYELFLGGSFYEKGARIGRRVTKLPAKKVPEAVRKLLSFYQEEKQPGEAFPDFVDRVGLERFEELVAEFKEVKPLHQEIESYMDWGETKIFAVERGEGECAI